MKFFPKSRNLRIAIAVFFFSGVIVGLVSGYYWGKSARSPRFSPSGFKQRLYERTVSELALTVEQQASIKPIFEKRFEKINQVKSQSLMEVEKIIVANYEEMAKSLTPEQQLKLQELKRQSLARIQDRNKERF